MKTAKTEELTTIQNRIRFVFTKSGQSQHEFAELLGIGQPHLSGVMTSKQPSKRLLMLLSEKTGVNLGWLETGEGEAFKVGGREEDPHELTRVLDKTREVLGSMEDEAERFELAAILLRELKKREKPKGGKIEGPALGPAGKAAKTKVEKSHSE